MFITRLSIKLPATCCELATLVPADSGWAGSLQIKQLQQNQDASDYPLSHGS